MKTYRKILIVAAVVMTSALVVIVHSTPPSALDIDLHMFSASSTIDSSSAKSATVSCPFGRYVIGTGAQVNIGQTGKAGVVSITVLPGGNAVTAVAAESGAGTNLNWNVKVYAI